MHPDAIAPLRLDGQASDRATERLKVPHAPCDSGAYFRFATTRQVEKLFLMTHHLGLLVVANFPKWLWYSVLLEWRHSFEAFGYIDNGKTDVVCVMTAVGRLFTDHPQVIQSRIIKYCE